MSSHDEYLGEIFVGTPSKPIVLAWKSGRKTPLEYAGSFWFGAALFGMYLAETTPHRARGLWTLHSRDAVKCALNNNGMAFLHCGSVFVGVLDRQKVEAIQNAFRWAA